MYKTTLRKTDGTEYTVDTYNGLTEQTTTTQSTHAPKEIFYGGVPKTGSMKIDDPQREIVDKVIDGTFDLSDTTVKTYYNDKLQGVFKTSDSDYEENSGELSVSLVDNINNWDKIQFAGRNYSMKADYYVKPNLYEILSYVLMTTLKWNNSDTAMQADVDTMCSRAISVNMGNTIEDMTIKRYLQRIIIPYDYLPPDNLRSTVDKICTVAQLNYAETNESDGIYPKNIRFFNARPAKAASEKIIVLPPSSQNEFPARDVLLKNRYDSLSLSSCSVKTNVQISKPVYSYETDLNIPSTMAEDQDKASSITQGGTYYGYAWIQTKFLSISFSVPKKQNHNLVSLRKIYRGVNDNGSAQIQIDLKTKQLLGTVSAPATIEGTDNISVDKIQTSWNSETLYTREELSPSFSFEYGLAGDDFPRPVSVKVSVPQQNNYKDPSIVTETDNEYKITNLGIIIERDVIGIAQSAFGIPFNYYPWSGTRTHDVPVSLGITINGDYSEISFENIETGVTGKNVAVINNSYNTILQDKANLISLYTDVVGTTNTGITMSIDDIVEKYGLTLNKGYVFDTYSGKYNWVGNFDAVRGGLKLNTTYYGVGSLGGMDEIVLTSGSYSSGSYTMSIISHTPTFITIEPITTHITNSVLSDYANGVSTCTTEITLDQLKYTDGTIAKQAGDGEIMHIGDVVRLDRNSFGDSIYNYADGNPYLWRVTGTTLIYDGYPHQKLELQEITSGNRGLKYMSWEMIESIANSGQAQNVFSIGDEKEIELSTGEKLTAVIIGFNHDKISDTKKAGITFFIKTPLATLYRMNSTTTPNGGVWDNCSMYETLNGDTSSSVFQKLPEDLRVKVKLVEKVFYDRANASHTSQDKLFLLSAAELGYTTDYAYGVEGTPYEYFKAEENKILYDSENITVNWWTRSCSNKLTGSVASGVSGSFLYSSKTATCLSLTATNFLRVAFAFCIGEVDA